jgi:hypothetical protein
MQKSSHPAGRYQRPAAEASRLIVIALLALILLQVPPGASAVEMTSLYTVEVPFDPADRDARDNAYRTALTRVLVRVTGTTAAAESPELAAAFPNAARYVLQYQPGADNTLLVSLDGPAIERILRQSGATVWDSNRPLTLVLLAVDRGQGEREIVMADANPRDAPAALSIDRNRALRERVLEVADLRGLPLVFPQADTPRQEPLSFTDVWGGFDEQLLATALSYGANSVLVGRIRPDSMPEQRWTWYHENQRRDWSGAPEQVINMLGDALAAQYAVGGDTAVETIRLTISGISSIHAYGDVQRLMNELRGLDSIAVKLAQADSMTYEITAKGAAERIGRALEQSGLFIRVDSNNGNAYRRADDPFAPQSDAGRAPVVLEFLYRSD